MIIWIYIESLTTPTPSRLPDLVSAISLIFVRTNFHAAVVATSIGETKCWSSPSSDKHVTYCSNMDASQSNSSNKCSAPKASSPLLSLFFVSSALSASFESFSSEGSTAHAGCVCDMIRNKISWMTIHTSIYKRVSYAQNRMQVKCNIFSVPSHTLKKHSPLRIQMRPSCVYRLLLYFLFIH